MDVRRICSSPLDAASSDINNGPPNSQGVAQSPYGSPKTSGIRLPALWKNLKAKLGSLSTSRSATNLTTLPLNIPNASASPCTSPSPQLEARSATPLQASKHRLFLVQASATPSIAAPPQGISARSGAASKPCGPELSSSTSPVAIDDANIVLTSDSVNIVASTAADGLGTPAAPQQRLLPASTTKIVADVPGPGKALPTAEPPRAIGRKLLALSPALPAAMRRATWSLDDYAITKRLFKGSSSAVYRATCRRSGIPVALKVYFLSRVPANVVHMMKREIEIHSQLLHKNVVRLYAAFLDEAERVVLVQEYAPNGDLYGILQKLGGRMLPDQVAMTVVRPFLEALSYLHSRGICHRDIKPENLLFSQSWRLLVADFGVSIDLNQERAVTRAGTEGYMAPEVERCPLKVEPDENKDDPRYAYSTAVDIWAVGVLAYELMIGFPPVVMPAAPAAPAVSGFVRSEMTAAALHFPASVPPIARSFVAAALAADPGERPTAAQLLQHPWLLQPSASATAVAAAATAALAPRTTVPAGGDVALAQPVCAADSGSPRCLRELSRQCPRAPGSAPAVSSLCTAA